MSQLVLQDVQFHDGGYCVQTEYLTGVLSAKLRRIHAGVVSFRHPVHGRCLIDTGYGPDFYSVTRKLPRRVLRYLTPVPRKQNLNLVEKLPQQGVSPPAISMIFLSHFHIDHIGSLALFLKPQLVYRQQAFQRLQSMTSWQQFHESFFSALLPVDFQERASPVADQDFQTGQGELANFRVLDYWGDGTLLLVDLPGHALGHTGYLLQTAEGPLFYATDAYWDHRQLMSQRKLPWIARHIQHRMADYLDTQRRLKRWQQETNAQLLACHCPLTAQRFGRDGNSPQASE